jgi:adenylate cyclase
VASVRRLSAIMFTDMVGSTASAQANESEALTLRDEQARIVRPLFALHQGREIKSLGDGFLAEFDSALRAVQCAIDIQQHLNERNSQPAATPIRLRIGIHLGDVEQRESDIFGDAVNIAARIEPLASPGGICISGEVFSQVRNKIPNGLEKLPPVPLKGLQVSIDVYQVTLPWTGGGSRSHSIGSAGIAVLPFTNISPDSKDEYFADGLTEELITVLSKLRELRVISRTSVMLYKLSPKSASQIGTELGVASILEGSVRKAGNRIRVTAQLIDAASDRHLWAETYDRELDDIFGVQTELAKQVAESLKIELRATEVARLEERPATRTDSYLAYLKGRSLMRDASSGDSRGSASAAIAQFELAISLDGRNAAAYAGLADAHRYRVYTSEGEIRATSDRAGRQAVARALELDPNLAEAHASLALIIWDDYEYLTAEKEYLFALSLNPSNSFAHCFYGVLLQDEGRIDDALREHRLAEATDPLWSENLLFLSRLLGWMGRLDEALVKVQKIGELAPDSNSHRFALLWYYLARSDAESFGTVMDRLVEGVRHPRAGPAGQALKYALAGQKERARAILEEEDTLPEYIPDESICAMASAEIGDLDRCFRWMNKACENHALMLQPFRVDPRFGAVRRDPRFSLLLKRMHLA